MEQDTKEARLRKLSERLRRIKEEAAGQGFMNIADYWEEEEREEVEAIPGFSPCDPFSSYRLYGDEKYSLQNMLLKDAGNLRVGPDDVVWEQWSDRLYSEMEEAWPLLKSSMSGDAFFAGCTDKSLLAFASKIVGGAYGGAKGVRVVRFTNCSSGHPCLRFTVVCRKGPKKEQNEAPKSEGEAQA
jgi:hypothetical protein